MDMEKKYSKLTDQEVEKLTDQEVEAKGVFTAYASVFGVKDSYGDVVVKGAFEKSLSVRKPKLLLHHRQDQPVGVIEDIYEDDYGLFVKGKLTMESPRAAETYHFLKSGALDALSIGYATVKSTEGDGVRYLNQVDLYEISIVTIPANEDAKIDSVKSLGEHELKVLVEKTLRDAGLSRKEAKTGASGAASSLKGVRDVVTQQKKADFIRQIFKQ